MGWHSHMHTCCRSSVPTQLTSPEPGVCTLIWCCSRHFPKPYTLNPKP